MVEKWIIKKNINGILYMSKNRIKLVGQNDAVDLIAHTGKTVAQLEKDPEILLNKAHNNFITVELVRDEINNEQMGQMFALLKDSMRQMMSDNKGSMEEIVDKISKIKPSESKIVVINDGGRVITAEDEKEEEMMRQSAIKDLLKKDDKSEKNIGNIGDYKEAQDESYGNENLLSGLED